MKAGALCHRVVIESAETTRDSHGQPIETWATFAADVFASIEPLSGREAFSAKQLHPEVTHKITIRYLDGLTPKMRIAFGERYFDIVSTLNVAEQGRELQITAIERI